MNGSTSTSKRRAKKPSLLPCFYWIFWAQKIQCFQGVSVCRFLAKIGLSKLRMRLILNTWELPVRGIPVNHAWQKGSRNGCHQNCKEGNGNFHGLTFLVVREVLCTFGMTGQNPRLHFAIFAFEFFSASFFSHQVSPLLMILYSPDHIGCKVTFL